MGCDSEARPRNRFWGLGKRLMNLNPHSFRKIVSTLLEMNGRGYWETSEENLDRLRELYQEVENRIEGIE